MKDYRLRYYTGEEPQVGDVVRLGGKEKAVEWTVRLVARDCMNIARGSTQRRGVYVCHYALVSR